MKSNSRIAVEAASKRYNFQSPYVVPVATSDGRPLKEKYIPKRNKKGYPIISVRMRKQKIDQKVLVHQVVAYQQFGDAMYDDGFLCRHLDNDKSNFNAENIALGTHRDNHNDNGTEVRIKIEEECKNAAKLQRVIKADQIQEILKLRADALTYREIAEKYGVAKNTIRYICLGLSYKEFYRELGERLKPEIC